MNTDEIKEIGARMLASEPAEREAANELLIGFCLNVARIADNLGQIALAQDDMANSLRGLEARHGAS